MTGEPLCPTCQREIPLAGAVTVDKGIVYCSPACVPEEPRCRTLDDGVDGCAMCGKPFSEAMGFLEDELEHLFAASKDHGLAFPDIARAVLHAALDAWGVEKAVRAFLWILEQEAPRVKEMVEPLLLMAIKKRGAREDA